MDKVTFVNDYFADWLLESWEQKDDSIYELITFSLNFESTFIHKFFKFYFEFNCMDFCKLHKIISEEKKSG